MGCAISPEKLEAQNKSKQIEHEMKKGQPNSALVIKLLLLGAGESGKSTIVKQMRIIHNKRYTSEELENFRVNIYENIIRFIEIIIETARKRNVILSDEIKADVDVVMEFAKHSVFFKIPQNIWDSCTRIWSISEIKDCIIEAEKFHLNVSAKELVDNIERISMADYSPNDKDILHSRMKTTGIKQIEFQVKDTIFQMYDVGGQRSERKKWIHCFENVHAILFVAPLSEYDQTLEEDSTTNRMKENLKLFESTISNPWLLKSSIILLLNKQDLLQQKIQHTPLTVCFPEYTGENTLEATREYIRAQYENTNKNPTEREIYTHFTCATDTGQVNAVFNAVTDIVLKKNLREYGLY